MRKLVIPVVCVVVALGYLAACASSNTSDIEPSGPPCDPLLNVGCGDGEKCSLLVESVLPQPRTRTACVPNGEARVGQDCTSAFANPGSPDEGLGFDDCRGGSLCLNGVCTEICQQVIAINPANDIDTCPDGEKACGLFSDVFEDVTDAEIGACATICDLFDPVECRAREGCYLSLVNGEATCATDAIGGELGEPCAGLNSCMAGLGCVLENASDRLQCAPYCKVADGTTAAGGDCAEALGPTAGDPRCIQINTFYDNVERVDDSLGMCVDCGDAEFSDRQACAPAS